MPIATDVITVLQGSALYLQRNYYIRTGGGTLTKAKFTVKENHQQDDSEALIQKEITNTPASSGQILDAGGSGVGVIQFNILGIDTAKLEYKKKYLYDIWVQTTTDQPIGIESGLMYAYYAITKSF